MKKSYIYAGITVLIWSTLATVVKIVLSALVLKEQITYIAVIALALIVGGILLQSISIKKRTDND